MAMTYHPPHLVNDTYAHSFGLKDPSHLYNKLAPGIWLMERRLTMTEMLMLADFEISMIVPGTLNRVAVAAKVKELYRPVWLGPSVFGDNTSALDFRGEPFPHPDTTPYSYWLRVDLVEPSERIRYPALPAKMNYKEGLDSGDFRELYSWDGTGFRLRDEAWGRE